MDFLDGLVLDHLVRRLFTPERMAELLAEHAARAKDGAAEASEKARAADKELRDIDTRIKRLYELVESGTALDDTLRNRLAEHRQRREEVLRLKGMAEHQRRMPRQLIDDLGPGGETMKVG
jgi:hypothetical protein